MTVVVFACEVVSGPIALCPPLCGSSVVTRDSAAMVKNLSAAAWNFWSGTDDLESDFLLLEKTSLTLVARDPSLDLPSLLGRLPILPAAFESGTEGLSDRGMMTNL